MEEKLKGQERTLGLPKKTLVQGIEERRGYWPKIKTIFSKAAKLIRGFWRGLATALGSLILLFFVFSFLGGGLSAGSGLGRGGITEEYITGEGENKLVYISLSGLIFEEAEAIGPFAGGTAITPKKVREFLVKAKGDEKVKGVILGINSPGGSAVASNRVWEILADFEKPVVVLMGDTAASGGYFIASAADKIVADKATVTGSIGVIAEIFNLGGLYEKLGVRVEVFKKGEFKDILSSARARTEEEKKMLDDLLSDAYDLFLERVAEGRELERSEVEQLAEGKIYSGREAQEVGLVDEVGGFDKAVDVAKELAGVEKARIVEYSTVSLWQSLFGGVEMGFLSRLFPQKINFYPRAMYLLEI